MTMRFHEVKLSVFDPEKKRWEICNHMTVLINEDFIYAVDAGHLFGEVSKVCEESEDFKNAKSKSKQEEIAESIFEKMLDKCIISEALQGKIYSRNTVWKIEIEENPIWS